MNESDDLRQELLKILESPINNENLIAKLQDIISNRGTAIREPKMSSSLRDLSPVRNTPPNDNLTKIDIPIFPPFSEQPSWMKQTTKWPTNK